MKITMSVARCLTVALLGIGTSAGLRAANVFSDTSGTNANVHLLLEFVADTNPNYYQLNQFSVAPNVSAPLSYSAIPYSYSSGTASGTLSVLNNGVGPASAGAGDLAAGSVYSDLTSQNSYGLLLDLGSIKQVSSITTYSAGDATRSDQNYQVWGATTFQPIVYETDPFSTGWTRIAIGSSYGSSGGLGDQSGAWAINLTAYTGYLGDFQYLFFAMQDTGQSYAAGAQAYMSEISVSAIPEPSTYAAIAGAVMFGAVIWQRRRKASVVAA